MKDAVYLEDLGVVCSLGRGRQSVWGAVRSASGRGIRKGNVAGRELYLGAVPRELYGPEPRHPFNNRVNAILTAALEEIHATVGVAVVRYGAHRVAVLIGSCDNGSELSLEALGQFTKTGAFPAGYSLECQRADLPARFAACFLGLSGPAIAYSTACASSASAMASARNMLLCGLCDAAVVGGADIVSAAVALGFSALEAVSDEPCRPFSRNRKGITLGEGAAVFVMTRDNLLGRGIKLLGVGESGDAHHMTAPDPEGTGAALAMERALSCAGIQAADVDYINLHGTGTLLNDAMEARALAKVFGDPVPASSTKSLTGHTLGAAGALELGICWMALSDMNPGKILPPQIWDGQGDEDGPAVDIVTSGRAAGRLERCMSNSFAFGGCNASLVIGK